MHDDIGAGLTQIVLMSEAAKQRKENELQLNEISRTSRRLVDNMSEIIWSLNPGNNTLDLLLSYLREQLMQLLEYSGIAPLIEFPQNGSMIQLNNAQRRNILLITKEIVHNSVKHSKATHIRISCRVKNNCLHFSVTDNGKGFDPVTKKEGNGMRNINKRVMELGGSLFFETSENGTHISYQIPVRNEA
jgi:signal transduction histidine kinase